MKLEDADSILLYGGSFDPPHRAHVELPQRAREKIGADLIAYLPAAQSPHKLSQAPTPAEHRLAMLGLALQGVPHTTILTDELDRAHSGQPSYTAETLEGLRDRLDPSVTLYWLMGADQIRLFDQWRSPERMVELAQLRVMVRPPQTRDALLGALPDDQRETWANRLIDLPRIAVSSTDLRQRIAQGQPTGELLDPAVRRYIDEHRLYR